MYEKIKEAIEQEIVEAKKASLQFNHMGKYYKLYDSDDGISYYNSHMNAEDTITEFKKILNFVLKCEEDWQFLCGSGVGKSNWGTENYPSDVKENAKN
jgi:hypothetical protein